MEYTINKRKYKIIEDLHTHTVYSHGKGSIEDNVNAAREKGLKRIGIADHGPGHLFYGIKRKDVPEMREEVQRLNAKYHDIEVLLSVEANIINRNGILDIRPLEFAEFDYVIAGYHYGVAGRNPLGSTLKHGRNIFEEKLGLESKKALAKNTKMIVKALENNDIKVLTHPGDKAPVDILELAVVCAKTDTLVEINTWHNSLNADDIKTMALADVKFIISSDAHSPNRVGDFLEGVHLALDAGLDFNRIVNVEIEDM